MAKKIVAVGTVIIYDDNTGMSTLCGPGAAGTAEYERARKIFTEKMRRLSPSASKAGNDQVAVVETT